MRGCAEGESSRGSSGPSSHYGSDGIKGKSDQAEKGAAEMRWSARTLKRGVLSGIKRNESFD